jgi:hypothetical protein
MFTVPITHVNVKSEYKKTKGNQHPTTPTGWQQVRVYSITELTVTVKLDIPV